MNKSVFVLSSKYEYVLWALLTSLFMLTPIFSKAQQYKQLTDVPTVYIETENNQSITSKEDYINCTVIFVDGGEVNLSQYSDSGKGKLWFLEVTNNIAKEDLYCSTSRGIMYNLTIAQRYLYLKKEEDN